MSPKLKLGHPPAKGQLKQMLQPKNWMVDLKEFEEARSNWKIREWTAKLLVPTVCFGFVSSIGLIVLNGMKIMELSPPVITSLCIAFPIEVVGVFGIMIRYLCQGKARTN